MQQKKNCSIHHFCYRWNDSNRGSKHADTRNSVKKLVSHFSVSKGFPMLWLQRRLLQQFAFWSFCRTANEEGR